MKVKLGDILEYEISNLIDDELNELSIISIEKPSYA